MPVTVEQVHEVLDPIEPDYSRVSELGNEALPHLQALVEADDSLLAAKAAYAASLLDDEGAAPILERAARSAEPTVRVAAAAALRNLTGQAATPALRHVLEDEDRGVRAKALSSMPAGVPQNVLTVVETIARSDPDPGVSAIARETLEQRRSAQSNG